MMPCKVVLAAGGTGGHVFPALSLAQTLTQQGHEVLVLTDARGRAFEVEKQRWEVKNINVPNPNIGGVLGKLKASLHFLFGYFMAHKIIRNFSADVVVGFGGYPSFAPVLAALFLRKPVVLHEQNSVLGRVNRLLSKKATIVAKSFKKTLGLEGEKTLSSLTGNPVREEIINIRKMPVPTLSENDEINVLIFGGSLGARILSDVVPSAIAKLPSNIRRRIKITQQCREEDVNRVLAVYNKHGVAAELETFFPQISELLKKTHLVISRSGASTIAELTVAGRPSILVPYSSALDNHQFENAMLLVESGAAWCIEEEVFDPDSLAKRLVLIFENCRTHGAMAAAAHSIGIPDAAERLADLVIQMASQYSNRLSMSDKLAVSFLPWLFLCRLENLK